MLAFLDGPAADQTLMCRRAPKFLRVVFNGKAWDALDQLSDEPKPTERLHCYLRVRAAGACHIRMSPRKNSGWYAMADYRHYAPQPPDDVMRSTARWRGWCVQEAETLAKSTEPDK
jgi:hypothetical protein